MCMWIFQIFFYSNAFLWEKIELWLKMIKKCFGPSNQPQNDVKKNFSQTKLLVFLSPFSYIRLNKTYVLFLLLLLQIHYYSAKNIRVYIRTIEKKKIDSFCIVVMNKVLSYMLILNRKTIIISTLNLYMY